MNRTEKIKILRLLSVYTRTHKEKIRNSLIKELKIDNKAAQTLIMWPHGQRCGPWR